MIKRKSEGYDSLIAFIRSKLKTSDEDFDDEELSEYTDDIKGFEKAAYDKVQKLFESERKRLWHEGKKWSQARSIQGYAESGKLFKEGHLFYDEKERLKEFSPLIKKGLLYSDKLGIFTTPEIIQSIKTGGKERFIHEQMLEDLKMPIDTDMINAYSRKNRISPAQAEQEILSNKLNLLKSNRDIYKKMDWTPEFTSQMIIKNYDTEAILTKKPLRLTQILKESQPFWHADPEASKKNRFNTIQQLRDNWITMRDMDRYKAKLAEEKEAGRITGKEMVDLQYEFEKKMKERAGFDELRRAMTRNLSKAEEAVFRLSSMPDDLKKKYNILPGMSEDQLRKSLASVKKKHLYSYGNLGKEEQKEFLKGITEKRIDIDPIINLARPSWQDAEGNIKIAIPKEKKPSENET